MDLLGSAPVTSARRRRRWHRRAVALIRRGVALIRRGVALIRRGVALIRRGDARRPSAAPRIAVAPAPANPVSRRRCAAGGFRHKARIRSAGAAP
ncbi:MAG: hypothetical protein ABI629_18600 [bacterium]